MHPTTPNGQRFTARTDWRTDPITRRMAALATLGFRIVIEQHHDDLTAKNRTVFHHAAVTSDPRRSALPHAKPLVRLFMTGDMERLDPEHPFLDALAAIANFEALEAWRLQNITACLAADAIPAGQPPLSARRSRLIPGIPPKRKDYVDVGNIANACALARIGIPVLSLPDRSTYRLAAIGESLNHQSAHKTAEIMTKAASGDLSWDHPFMTARAAVLNYIHILETCAAARAHTVITWRNRTDRRSATLLSSATSHARDIAHKHMR
jgi:hypothetical protein